jgi:hypothetical protein
MRLVLITTMYITCVFLGYGLFQSCYFFVTNKYPAWYLNFLTLVILNVALTVMTNTAYRK